MNIKFGTDGWRAIIGKDYTVENVMRVTLAVAEWLKENQKVDHPTVIVGHDCRFGGPLFVDAVAKTLAHKGINVIKASKVISTPIISYTTKLYKADLGIVITASHNPPEYNGYKLKTSYGGPLTEEYITEIEGFIPNQSNLNVDTVQYDETFINVIDLEQDYIKYIYENFDIEAIKNAPFEWAYDAMYGSGQSVMRQLFPDITFLHCDYNPGFDGQAPEPIHKNLIELSEMIILSENIDCAFATDGDADRIGLYNAQGKFIDAHHIMLLLIHYLVHYKGLTGKVITTFSASSRISKICDYYNLDYEIVKIGFKYIAPILLESNGLLGGEESGGIAVKGHIPERDGIWCGLLIWEFMAKTGKSLQTIINEVYAIVGSFAYDRLDLHITEEQKKDVITACEKGFENIGTFKVIDTQTIDGYKFFTTNTSWIMVRTSGTEPVLRIYAEGDNIEEVATLLKTMQNILNL